jgi:hypothetical protein
VKIGIDDKKYFVLLGTFSSKDASDTCKPCPANTYASEEGSNSCLKCNIKTEYSGKEYLTNGFDLS